MLSNILGGLRSVSDSCTPTPNSHTPLTHTTRRDKGRVGGGGGGGGTPDGL